MNTEASHFTNVGLMSSSIPTALEIRRRSGLNSCLGFAAQALNSCVPGDVNPKGRPRNCSSPAGLVAQNVGVTGRPVEQESVKSAPPEGPIVPVYGTTPNLHKEEESCCSACAIC